MEITDFDKRVYNLYLASVKRMQGKPYRKRVNFDGFERDRKFPMLKNLSSLFKELPHLMCVEYFEAPFHVFEPKTHFDLSFYASGRGISAYTKHIKGGSTSDPDEQLDNIKKSFLFIYKFCKDNKISLKDYPFYKSISLNDCLKHIKNHNVSMYVAFSIPELYSILINLDAEIYSLFFGDISILDLQRKYERSKVAPKLCVKLKEEISKRLEKSLENTTQI